MMFQANLLLTDPSGLEALCFGVSGKGAPGASRKPSDIHRHRLNRGAFR
jgi:hypothetical protein